MCKSESQEELCTIRMMEKQHMCKRIEQEKFSPSTFSMQKRLSHGNNIFENDSPIELCTSLNHKRSMYSRMVENICARESNKEISPSTFSMQKRLCHGNNIFENDSPSHPPELPGSFKPPRKVQ